MNQESFTWKNFNEIKDFYGVTEETLKRLKKEILEKMFKAIDADDMDALHSLGYHIVKPNYVPSKFCLEMLK